MGETSLWGAGQRLESAAGPRGEGEVVRASHSSHRGGRLAYALRFQLTPACTVNGHAEYHAAYCHLTWQSSWSLPSSLTIKHPTAY